MFEPSITIRTADPRVQIAEREKTAIGRFWNFFLDAPLWGGKEWETLEADAIANFFKNEAIHELHAELVRKQHSAVTQHKKLNSFVRLWKDLRGWNEPIVPTISELELVIAQKCRRLADWAEQNQGRRFYEDSDLTHFITKPRRVADILSPIH